MMLARCLYISLVLLATLAHAADAPSVVLQRIPDGGIQPQVAAGTDGTIHLIYYKGEAAKGDLYYARLPKGASAFSEPIRVNSHPNSAIAAGTIRGAQLALGKNDRVHVAWNGSADAQPRAAGNASPMLYTRLNDAGDAFEPQRNVIQRYVGLDGGGSIAADARGNVYIAWHAPHRAGGDEQDRQVWVARSTDEGKTFTEETAASDAATVACACCGMRIGIDGQGHVLALYRGAAQTVNRDMFLLRSADQGKTFTSASIHPLKIGMCVMSSATVLPTPAGALLAWETRPQVYFASVDAATGNLAKPIGAPGEAKNRKYPVLAVNSQGQILLAWAESGGWNKPGTLAWQVFDQTGQPIPDASGQAPDLPTWSMPAVFAREDGSFVVLY